MEENLLKEIIISTIEGEKHLGENLKKQCIDYIKGLDKTTSKDTERINKLINEVTIKQCELEKKDKIIDLMAENITNMTGSCPLDYNDYEIENCERCEDTYKDCWIGYFTKKVDE